jgi:hypothetical protein
VIVVTETTRLYRRLEELLELIKLAETGSRTLGCVRCRTVGRTSER